MRDFLGRYAEVLADFVLGVVLGYGVFSLIRIMTSFDLFDYRIYYQAVKAMELQLPIYQAGIDINYSPAALILLSPVGWVSIRAGELMMTLLSTVALLLSLTLLFRLLGGFSLREKLASLALIVLAFPYKFTLGMGQINLVILLLIVSSLSLYFAKYESLGGILLGVVSVFKLSPLILLLYFVKRGRWRVVVAAVVSYLLLNLLSMVVVGWSTVSGYYQLVLPSIPTIGNSSYYNQALSGFLARQGMAGSVGYLVNYLGLIGLAGAGYLLIPKREGSVGKELLYLGYFLICGLIGLGLAWQHHLVWLILPFLALWREIKSSHSYQIAGLTIGSYILVSANIKEPGLWTSKLQTLSLSHGLWGMLGLLGILLSLIYREKSGLRERSKELV